MSDLVGNPGDWFSHNEAHIVLKNLGMLICLHSSSVDLHLCFSHIQNAVFLITWSILSPLSSNQWITDATYSVCNDFAMDFHELPVNLIDFKQNSHSIYV